MLKPRKKTREVKIRDIGIGGNNPVRVQSMTSTSTVDIEATLKQIEELSKADCELIRIAIPDRRSLEAFREIRKQVDVPLIADIHFNYRLAIGALEAGADKIRINPGNIGDKKKVLEVIEALKQNKKAVRIGVNSGSLELDLIDKHQGVTSQGLVESAIRWVNYFTENGFEDIVVSIKSSSVIQTIEANLELSSRIEFPIHIGVTEAGPLLPGTVKSAIALGVLLLQGVGDTIRVSLTEHPVKEVEVAWEILKSLGIRANGPLIISCPTCARTRIDLVSLVKKVQEKLKFIKYPIKVAIMGCEVNGPGEAREADIGIAAEPGRGVIFKRGKIIKRVKEKEILEVLMEEINNMLEGG